MMAQKICILGGWELAYDDSSAMCRWPAGWTDRCVEDAVALVRQEKNGWNWYLFLSTDNKESPFINDVENNQWDAMVACDQMYLSLVSQADDLISILSRYCGERGTSESAKETLLRIIQERDDALSALKATEDAVNITAAHETGVLPYETSAKASASAWKIADALRQKILCDKNALSVVTPFNTQSYLQKKGWVRRENKNDSRISYWERQGFEVLVPLVTSPPDYSQRIKELIDTLAIIENRSPEAVLADIASGMVGSFLDDHAQTPSPST